MTTFRPINREDVPAVAAYSMRALRAVVDAEDMPLRISEKKIRNTVDFFATKGSHHFQRAAFDDGVCVGAIAAFAAEMSYFEREEAHIMFCHATKVGAGAVLIGQLMKWADDEIRIRRVSWTFNSRASRLGDLMARRFGFNARLETLVWVKE